MEFTLSTTATKTSAPGEYPITVTGEETQGNYTVTFVPGTLTVTKAEEIIVTISGVQETVMYDGVGHMIIGFHATSNNAEYNEFVDENNPRNYKFEGTIEVTGLNVGTYQIDLSNVKFTNTNPEKYPNVTFRFNPANHHNTLTIIPRTVVMTSASDTKEYDGEPLTNETVTVTGNGFVGGEGATYTFTGTQTEEGSSQNTFTYTLTGGALAGNYNINVNYGTLTVTAAEVVEEPEPPLARPAEEIDDDDTPLAGGNAWALINLISMILTVCVSLGMIITYFKKKKDEEEDEKTGEPKRELTEEEKEQNERRKGKFLGLIPGIGSVVAFFLTEDLTAPNMVLTDRWTVLMLAILVIGAALAYLTRNEKDEDEEEKTKKA